MNTDTDYPISSFLVRPNSFSLVS